MAFRPTTLGGFGVPSPAPATPEDGVAALDGRLPVVMLPVRIETRFGDGGDTLHVRVFPDQIHIDAHDPALTPDELAAGRWYWETRWAAPGDEAVATSAWEAVATAFRPGRARYVVDSLRPAGPLGEGTPVWPTVPQRAADRGRRAEATALPERWAAIGYQRGAAGLVEVFRVWSGPVRARLAVTPWEDAPPSAGGLASRLAIEPPSAWLTDPEAARRAGMMVTVRQADLKAGHALRDGIERLVVLGARASGPADPLGALFTAHRASGALAFVAQGTPTNNTGEVQSGFDRSRAAEVAAWAPGGDAPPGEDSAAGRLGRALGIPEATLAAAPGAERREHAWASALVDVLWEATGGHHLHDMLDPVGTPAGVDALRAHAAAHLFAAGPLPVIRVRAQPYGVLPVAATRRLAFAAHDAAGPAIAHFGGRLREMFVARLDAVPHLGRAADRDGIDDAIVALLQRTPVPWTLRSRYVLGPVERKAMCPAWDALGLHQDLWTSLLLPWLGIVERPRVAELTHEAPARALDVPLVRKGAAGTAWIDEILALLAGEDARLELDLRRSSATLLEALVAFAAVREIDRAGGEVLVAAGLAPTARVRTPESVRIEPASPGGAFGTPHARSMSPLDRLDPSHRLSDEVSLRLGAEREDGFVAIGGRPHDPLYRLARFERALTTLREAPPDALEWALRGYLDCFATRLDAWLTSLATARLALRRAAQPAGAHVGCFGWVEDLRPDVGPAAESVGYIHAPSIAHATAAAVLRAGRMAHRGDDGEIFDLEITADRTREALALLEGVAEGQSIAALLGYRIERRLRDAALSAHVLPLRRRAPMQHADAELAEPVEAIAARDVVDGVTLLDRWREAPEALLAEAGIAAGERAAVGAVLDAVAALYDAVSDVQMAEAVYQTSIGNLDRAGAALAGHDRQERPPELEFVRTPRSGHTVGARVVVAMSDAAAAPGWPGGDPRRLAEPRLDAWLGRVLGPARGFVFTARWVRADRTAVSLTPVALPALRLGPLSVVLAAQRPGGDRPSELEARLALRFAAQIGEAGEGDRIELLDEGPDDAPGGLGRLRTLAAQAAKLIGAPALTAADLAADPDEAAAIDLGELAARAAAVGAAFAEVQAQLGALLGDEDKLAASTCARWLEAAMPFAPLDALPEVPATHPDADEILRRQLVAVAERLATVEAAVAARKASPPDGSDAHAIVEYHTDVIRALLGPGQPVLPTFGLAAPDDAIASLADRAALLGGDELAPITWLHRRALVRPPLDPLAALLTHAEAGGADVPAELAVVQRPHRPGAGWCGLPAGFAAAPPPAGTVGVVIHALDPLDLRRPLAGLTVDGWTETIPSTGETTAVSFHYDAPGARAPQAVLIAVHPAVSPGTWDFATLAETVAEAIDLTHLRAVGAPELTALDSLLPALYLPDNHTHDVPGVSLLRLREVAQSLGLVGPAEATVMGKD